MSPLNNVCATITRRQTWNEFSSVLSRRFSGIGRDLVFCLMIADVCVHDNARMHTESGRRCMDQKFPPPKDTPTVDNSKVSSFLNICLQRTGLHAG